MKRCMSVTKIGDIVKKQAHLVKWQPCSSSSFSSNGSPRLYEDLRYCKLLNTVSCGILFDRAKSLCSCHMLLGWMSKISTTFYAKRAMDIYATVNVSAAIWRRLVVLRTFMFDIHNSYGHHYRCPSISYLLREGLEGLVICFTWEARIN